jgi:hypothetical protein
MTPPKLDPATLRWVATNERERAARWRRIAAWHKALFRYELMVSARSHAKAASSRAGEYSRAATKAARRRKERSR